MNCLNRQKLHLVIVLTLVAVMQIAVQAEEYGLDTWTTANGLPQNTVTGVVQTPDGYLWLSTFDGLARFDGVRFTIFDRGNTKGIVNNRFARLVADREGAFYAITEDNVVTVYRDGQFTSYTQFAAAGEPIATIETSAAGDPIFVTDKGVYTLQGPRLKQLRRRKSGYL